ncbi:MAG: methionyl-tRNA formyltransferase [Gemmatimonadota bacterium]|nr:methionyl-tRNA formyltransferase [Gemmatimonadota bacterium]
MRVLFWGSPGFAVEPLRALHGSAHNVVGVVCQPDRAAGRGRALRPPLVKTVAESLGLTVIQPELPRGEDFLARIKSLDPDISMVVAYGHILRPEMLSLPRHGSINLHASLLPAYRGAAPIQRAVLAGETTTGITVIQMDEGMDTGDILAREEVMIGSLEPAGELADRLSRLGAGVLLEVLGRITDGSLRPEAQSEQGVSYAPKVKREQARLDWRDKADNIACAIRAFDPAPGAFCFYRGKMLKLFCPALGDRVEKEAAPGRITGVSGQGLAVCCGDGCIVSVREFQAQGKKRMPAEEFLRGSRLVLGDVLE